MKQLTALAAALLMALHLTSCIGDDLVFDEVEPELRITSLVDTIALDSNFQFEAMYLNRVGMEEMVEVTWNSSDPAVISIDADGLARAEQLGPAVISATYGNGGSPLSDSLLVYVGMNTVVNPAQKSGTVNTTSSYALHGDFTLSQVGPDLILAFGDDYMASTALPGLYVYLSNNRNTSAGALEIGAVQVFSGAHSYTIPNTGINDYAYVLYYCKPFNVKVGDGEIQ